MLCLEQFSRFRYPINTQKGKAYREKIKQHFSLNPLKISSFKEEKKEDSSISHRSHPPTPEKKPGRHLGDICITEMTPGDPGKKGIPLAKEGHTCKSSSLRRRKQPSP